VSRNLAIGAAAPAVFLVAYLILDALFGKTSMQRRLDLLRRFAVTRADRRGGWRAAIRRAAGRLGERLGRLTRLRRYRSPDYQSAEPDQQLLDAAAVPIRPSEWLVIRIGSALLLAAVLAALLPWWLGALIGLVAGFAVPNSLLRVRVDRRKRAFAEQLPDTLQMIVSSLRSGFTLQHGLEASVRDSSGPVAAELRRALSETRLGAELEDALEGVGTRTGNPDMRWLTMAIKLQREVGGSLSEVLQTTADTMREREQLRRNVRALSAEGRLSATILVAMPLLIATWMVLFRRAYVSPLWTHPLGLVFVGAAVVLMVVGIVWLRAVVKVEA
jgi:tight adherence protein B